MAESRPRYHIETVTKDTLLEHGGPFGKGTVTDQLLTARQQHGGRLTLQQFGESGILAKYQTEILARMYWNSSVRN